MRGVDAIGSGELARLGCSFWLDVKRRVGFWDGAASDEAMSPFGSLDAGFIHSFSANGKRQ